MALARVVEFEDVTPDRIAQLKGEVEGSDRPENLPATEVIILHNADDGKALAIVLFDNEADYQQGDETLNAMPADETPGRRAAVTKYDVAARMQA
jgi:hypothetical protein